MTIIPTPDIDAVLEAAVRRAGQLQAHEDPATAEESDDLLLLHRERFVRHDRPMGPSANNCNH